jgi:hypothetical protein
VVEEEGGDGGTKEREEDVDPASQVVAVKSAGVSWWPRVTMSCTLEEKGKEREYAGKGSELMRSIFTVASM